MRVIAELDVISADERPVRELDAEERAIIREDDEARCGIKRNGNRRGS